MQGRWYYAMIVVDGVSYHCLCNRYHYGDPFGLRVLDGYNGKEIASSCEYMTFEDQIRYLKEQGEL